MYMLGKIKKFGKRVGRNYVDTTTTQMISVGKGLDFVGKGLATSAGLVATGATLTAQPEIAAPAAGLAVLGTAMSVGGKVLKSSGRVGRNTIIRKEKLSDQNKHMLEFKGGLLEGVSVYNSV